MSYPAETHNGEVTSWIPLTTTYSPSAGCYSIFRLEAPSLVAFDPGAGSVNPNINCQPSQVTTWWNQAALGVGNTAVSILPLTCPQGWSTVETSILSGVSTLAMCCPSAYTLTNEELGGGSGVNGNCASNVSRGQVLTFASTGYNTNDWSTATTTMDLDSYVGAIAIVGWNVPMTSTSMSSQAITSVLIQSSTSSASQSTQGSEPSTEPGTSPASQSMQGSSVQSHTSNSTQSAGNITPAPVVGPGSNPSSVTTTPDTTASLPATSSSNSQSSGGLSAGVKAGIGVGVGIGFIGVAALLVALYILLRRKRASDAAQHQSEPAPSYEPKYTDMDEPSYTQYQNTEPHYSQQDVLHELPNDRTPGELAAKQSPAELATQRESVQPRWS